MGPVHLDLQAIGGGKSDQFFGNFLLSYAPPEAEILKTISSTHLSSSALQQPQGALLGTGMILDRQLHTPFGRRFLSSRAQLSGRSLSSAFN
jgi:hypothetical protein